MIIESIVNIFVGLFKFVFGLLPDIPKLPALTSPFEGFKVIVSKGLRLLGVFLDVSLFKPLFLIVLGLISVRKVYSLVMFVKDKLKFF